MFLLGIFFSWLVRVLRSQFLCYESVNFVNIWDEIRVVSIAKKTSYFDEGDHIAGRSCLPNNVLDLFGMTSLGFPWMWGQKLHIGTSMHHTSWYCWWPISCELVEVGSFSYYLQRFIRPRWLFGTSSINSIIMIFMIHVRKLLSKNHMVNQNQGTQSWCLTNSRAKTPSKDFVGKGSCLITSLQIKMEPKSHPSSHHVPCSLPTCS